MRLPRISPVARSCRRLCLSLSLPLSPSLFLSVLLFHSSLISIERNCRRAYTFRGAHALARQFFRTRTDPRIRSARLKIHNGHADGEQRASRGEWNVSGTRRSSSDETRARSSSPNRPTPRAELDNDRKPIVIPEGAER